MSKEIDLKEEYLLKIGETEVKVTREDLLELKNKLDNIFVEKTNWYPIPSYPSYPNYPITYDNSSVIKYC